MTLQQCIIQVLGRMVAGSWAERRLECRQACMQGRRPGSRAGIGRAEAHKPERIVLLEVRSSKPARKLGLADQLVVPVRNLGVQNNHISMY